jgi:ribosomal protein S7
MARAMVAGGLKPQELGAAYGFSDSQISVIINSPLFELELARIGGKAEDVAVDVRKDMRALGPACLEVLVENLVRKDEDRKLATTTAFDVLDRGGFTAKQVPQGGGKHLHLHHHEAKEKAKKMSNQDLLEDVMDLVEDEAYAVEVEE